jgi:hypothetical protein
MPYRPLSAEPGTGVQGTVYLLHLDQPLEHARHYRGWALDMESRQRHNAAGTGARMLAVAKARGITWQLAASEPGDKNRERQLKNRGGAVRLCPICREKNESQGK